jgi:hypothetical protein
MVAYVGRRWPAVSWVPIPWQFLCGTPRERLTSSYRSDIEIVLSIFDIFFRPSHVRVAGVLVCGPLCRAGVVKEPRCMVGQRCPETSEIRRAILLTRLS